VQWAEFRIGDLFDNENGDFDIQNKHINGKGDYVITAGLTNNGVLGKTDIKAKLFNKNTITVDMFGDVFFRQHKYKLVTHARVFSLIPKIEINNKIGNFVVSRMKYFSSLFGYENMCSYKKIKDFVLTLPITASGTPNYTFMERFITLLEAYRLREVEEYLQTTNLTDTELTKQEKNVLDLFVENEHGATNVLNWKEFNLEKLFGKATRGKRLKSDDRIKGDLPFVTAGEKDTGISAFISNDVHIFNENTITIDMFGSAKYRNYKYGADDHIAVVHTENIPKYATIFITTSVHKTSYFSGQFHYGRNFYPKDADELNILLPTTSTNQPDFETMQTLIKGLQKLVIKDMVTYISKKIESTKTIIERI